MHHTGTDIQKLVNSLGGCPAVQCAAMSRQAAENYMVETLLKSLKVELTWRQK